MADEKNPITAPFPINMLVPHLSGYLPPPGSFDPKAGWEHSYSVHTLASVRGTGGPAGSLHIRRENPSAGDFMLHVKYEKPVPSMPPGCLNRVSAEMRCRSDALSTPTEWSFGFEAVTPEGKPVEYTRLRKSAVAKGGEIEMTDGRYPRRIAAPTAYTVRWALWDAVQRLPRAAFAPLRFALFDHGDELKPNQALSFRGTVEVILGERPVQQQRKENLEKGTITKTSWGREGGRKVRLHGYDLVGDGILPWVYWVDDQGRLIFAIGGIEGYILTGEKTL